MNNYNMFYELRFPENISYNFNVISEFKTDIITAKSGKEQRNTIWENEKLKFKINNENLTNENINEIFNFFKLMKGRSNGFRFKNWANFKATNEFLGIVNNNSIFQLIKGYIIADCFDKLYSITKKITKPVLNTVKIYQNDSEITDFEVNYITGEVNIKTNLSENDLITADFEFDVPVRFNSDSIELNMLTENIGIINNLELIEI